MNNGEFVKLGSLAGLRTGQTFKYGFENDPAGKLAVLLPKDIENGAIVNTYVRINQNNVSSLDTHLLKKGEIIMANKGTKFSTFLYNGNPDYAVATTAFYVITPSRSLVPEYLKWYLDQPEVKAYFHSNITGSVIPSINKMALSDLPVPVISQEEQHYLCNFIKKTEEEHLLLKNLLAKREAFSKSFIWEHIQKLLS